MIMFFVEHNKTNGDGRRILWKKKKDFTLTFYYLQLLRGSMQRTPSVSDSEKARFLQHIIFFLKAVLCYSRLEQQEHTNRGSGTFNTYTHVPPPPNLPNSMKIRVDRHTTAPPYHQHSDHSGNTPPHQFFCLP